MCMSGTIAGVLRGENEEVRSNNRFFPTLRYQSFRCWEPSGSKRFGLMDSAGYKSPRAAMLTTSPAPITR